MVTKKAAEQFRSKKYLNRACREVAGFDEMLRRFQRNASMVKSVPVLQQGHLASIFLLLLQASLRVRLTIRPATFRSSNCC